MNIVWIPFFPLLAFLLNGLFFKTKASIYKAGVISFLGTLFSFVVLLTHFSSIHSGQVVTENLWQWVNLGTMSLDVSFLLDSLSYTLTFMVTGIGSLITLFSMGYMKDDPRPGKYFSYLSLFIFFMLLLTLSSNLLVLFFGWEGVGLCSYLLIGFWYEDNAKASAGKKAFITNRIGDFGVVLGLMGYAIVLGTINFQDFKSLPLDLILQNEFLLTISSLLLVFGVTGKSAQLPLYVWLPDAMAGPTPVTALIHAATMVTAGIFLLCRISFIIAPLAIVMNVIAWIGALTALFAAFIAVTQKDIKKVLAYSTVSQIGYMMLACGVGAFSSGMFHVFTHGFFKALLFLSAGAIIFSLHHEQDITHMGGLRHKMPKTFLIFLIALLAISGLPFFAGFFSKDEIMWLTLNFNDSGIILYIISLVTAGLTSFYMTRLFCLVFLGKSRFHEDKDHPIHDPSWLMLLPLTLLALCTLCVGYLGLPHFLSHDNARMFQIFLEKNLKVSTEIIYSEQIEHMMMFLSVLVVIFSMLFAFIIYVKKENVAEKLKDKFFKIWSFSFAKGKLDEFYAFTLLRPFHKVAHFSMDVLEAKVINNAVEKFAGFFSLSSYFINKNKEDSLQGNLLWILCGLIVALLFFIFFLF